MHPPVEGRFIMDFVEDSVLSQFDWVGSQAVNPSTNSTSNFHPAVVFLGFLCLLTISNPLSVVMHDHPFRGQ